MDVFAVLALNDAAMKLQEHWNHMPMDVASYAEMVPGLGRLAVRAAQFETINVEPSFNRKCKLNSPNVPDSYVRRTASQVRPA